jgi:hypothetical protein
MVGGRLSVPSELVVDWMKGITLLHSTCCTPTSGIVQQQRETLMCLFFISETQIVPGGPSDWHGV